MSSESLRALLLSNIPELSESIARSRDELVVIERIYAQTHNITQMVRELRDLLTSLNVPKHTGHVAGRSEDASVVNEAAATEVADVSAELSRNSCWAFPCAQIVDGADVVQTAACHIVAAGRICASHDPG